MTYKKPIKRIKQIFYNTYGQIHTGAHSFIYMAIPLYLAAIGRPGQQRPFKRLRLSTRKSSVIYSGPTSYRIRTIGLHGKLYAGFPF